MAEQFSSTMFCGRTMALVACQLALSKRGLSRYAMTRTCTAEKRIHCIQCYYSMAVSFYQMFIIFHLNYMLCRRMRGGHTRHVFCLTEKLLPKSCHRTLLCPFLPSSGLLSKVFMMLPLFLVPSFLGRNRPAPETF